MNLQREEIKYYSIERCTGGYRFGFNFSTCPNVMIFTYKHYNEASRVYSSIQRKIDKHFTTTGDHTIRFTDYEPNIEFISKEDLNMHWNGSDCNCHSCMLNDD